MASLSPATHRPISDHMRQKLLILLEQEGMVTRNRMAEVLGVSRMTADRMASQLTTLGLLIKAYGNDPVTGRKSHLLTLADDVPLLLLEADEDKPYMTAYCYEQGILRAFHTEYHFTYSAEGNVRHLRDLAKSLWRLPEELPCVFLHQPRLDRPRFLPKDGIETVSESEVTAAYLEHQPALKDACSLLHLRVGGWLFATLYVRQEPEAPWFAPMGRQCFDLPDSIKTLHEQADFKTLIPYLSAYDGYLSPDIMLLENDPADLSDFEPISIRVPARDLIRLRSEAWPEDDFEKEIGKINRVLTHACLYTSQNPFPLWVSGVLRKNRTRRWLGQASSHL